MRALIWFCLVAVAVPPVSAAEKAACDAKPFTLKKVAVAEQKAAPKKVQPSRRPAPKQQPSSSPKEDCKPAQRSK